MPVEEGKTELGQIPSTNSSTGIIDINEDMHQPNANPALPRTPVVCKPFEDAFQKVFEIANINPHRTVRSLSPCYQVYMFLTFMMNKRLH